MDAKKLLTSPPAWRMFLYSIAGAFFSIIPILNPPANRPVITLFLLAGAALVAWFNGVVFGYWKGKRDGLLLAHEMLDRFRAEVEREMDALRKQASEGDEWKRGDGPHGGNP